MPIECGATTAGQASAGERAFERPDRGGGVIEGEDQHRRFVADPERLQPPAQLSRLHPPAEGAGEDVAGEAPLGLAGDAAAHQLEGDDGDRLLQDQPLEIAEAAGVADDHHPGLGRAAAGRDHRVGQGPAGDRGMGGDEGVTVADVAERFLADRADRVGGELAAEAAPGEALAAAVEDGDGAADRGGDRRRDLLQAALLQDQPLQPSLHGDAALQNLVLLVDEAGEGFLGDRDERRRVGDLEQREVPLLGLLDQRFRQFAVAEAGAEAEPGEVAVGEQADEGALLGGAVERDPGAEHQLAAGEPGGRVLELGDVDPSHRRSSRSGAGREIEVELIEQALDGEQSDSYRTTCSQASERTP